MKTIKELIVRDTIFFDLETSGTTIQTEKIVELCAIKYKMDGTTEIMEKKFNPVIPISEDATAIHGFTNDMLKDYPTFAECAIEIYNFFNGCDLGGFNSIKFDMQFMYEEFANCGLHFNYGKINMIDSFMIYNKFEPRTLSASYTKYTGKTFENAHSAVADIKATIEIFEKQLEVYNLGEKTMEEISNIVRSTNDGDLIVDLNGSFARNIKTGDYYFVQGKHKNKRVQDELYYLKYLATGDMSKNIKDVAKKLYFKYTNVKL